MALYVVDTSSFIVMSHYFPDRFPTFWTDLDRLVANGSLVSVSEVLKELSNQVTKPHLAAWLKKNKSLFTTPEPTETRNVAKIFSVTKFQALLKRKDILEGKPVADPWVIARAMALNGCVVTEESTKPNVLRIPQVCAHFNKLKCINLEGMMLEQSLRY